MLPIYEDLFKLNSNKTQMDYDATSFYASALWDHNSVYPKTETGFAFKPYMNDVYVEAFNIQTYNQDGDESAKLTIKFYNTPDLTLKIYRLKKKLKKSEVTECEMDMSLKH